MKQMLAICGVLLIGLGCLANALAQSPDQFSVTEINGMFGPEVTTQIYRDGQRAMQESIGPAAAGFSKGMHTRTFYDLGRGKSYTIDLNNPSTGCGTATFSGDWGDPFAMSTDMLRDLAGKNPKPIGSETVAGVPTKVMSVSDAASKTDFKLWIDEAHHLVMKLQAIPTDGSPKTMIEIKELSLTKPAASLMAVPSACLAAAAGAPPSEQERIAAETGGNPANYTNAIMPPASKTACTVLFKVVQAGSLQAITGFKAGLDRQIDPSHMPSYTMGGSQTFSGGNIHDVTAQFRNGALRIENAPPQFDLELLFGQSGDASALIYRQCYTPETTLLFVVKNPQKLSDGGDWLWVKK